MRNLSKPLIGAITFIVIWAIIHYAGGSVLVASVSALIGAGMVIMLVARSRGEDPKDVAKEVVDQAMRPDPGAKERPIHERLCRLNQAMRLAGLDISVLQAAEELIDLLREVTPEAMERTPGAESTFDLEQLATKHLPELMAGYIELSMEDRQATKAEITDQLKTLCEKVKELADLLDKDDLNQFEASKQFVNIKFDR